MYSFDGYAPASNMSRRFSRIHFLKSDNGSGSVLSKNWRLCTVLARQDKMPKKQKQKISGQART
jgi:hypothetical protein